MAHDPPIPHNMSSAQLARYLGVSLRTVERWREERRGPPWSTLGRRIVYPSDGVAVWLAEQTTNPTDPTPTDQDSPDMPQQIGRP